MKGHLPPTTLAQSVSYPNDAETSFIFHNNLKLSQVKRQLIIDAKVGLPEDEFSPKEVGLFTFLLDKIEKRCPSDQSWIDASDCVEPTSSECASSIKISASKSNVGREYIEVKKNEAIRALKNQVGHIETFNKDPHHDFKLSADVRGIGGLSLLHAALQLSDDTSLIERLLKLGADTKAESREGTPLTFAKKLLERAHSKVKNHEENGATSSRLAAHEARFAKAEQIYRILELHQLEQDKNTAQAVKAKKVSFSS